ncbi:MAG: carboxypeptidase regulatory-like domain-containing protein [bacterium]
MIVKKLFPGLLAFTMIAGITMEVGYAQNPNNKGIWLSNEEIAALPTSGKAWQNVKSAADKSTGRPNVSDQDNPVNVRVLAKALVYARLGDETYRNEVIDACMAAIGTERGGRTLALGRELGAYVIAADLVGLPPDKDGNFREWLRSTLSETLSGRTLRSTHEDRPNNWGTHAGATRAAIARYLDDNAELERTAKVFKGYLGDRSSYADFEYGNLSWQADPSKPVGINPKGATKEGHSIDGVMPDDMRRGGGFKFPPSSTGYPWEGLQGMVVQAEILYRAGYETWSWQDKAILRAVQFLHDIGWEAEGDDTWTPWIINYRYGTNFSAKSPTSPGKNNGWTDWTHGPGRKDGGRTTGVEGKVENSVNGTAVEGAKVQLRQDGSSRYETTSSSSGRYSFLGIAAGTYELLCTRNGFADWTGTVVVEEEQLLVGQNIRLAPIGDSVPPEPPRNVRVTSSD